MARIILSSSSFSVAKNILPKVCGCSPAGAGQENPPLIGLVEGSACSCLMLWLLAIMSRAAIKSVCHDPLKLCAYPFAPSVRPVHAQQILFGVVVIVQLALIGMMQRLADAAGQMNIRRGHQRRAIFLFHRHDAFERMFRPFVFFMVVHEMHDFVAMGRSEER